MLGLNIILGIVGFLLYIIMMSVMIIFERDKPKNIIIWSIIFLLTSIFGYIVYAILRSVFYKKKESLLRKEREDAIFVSLVDDHIYKNKVSSGSELNEFNALAYNSKFTTNNQYHIFNDYAEFKADLMTEIQSADRYIIVELTRFNCQDFELIKDLLMDKAQDGVVVKLIHDKRIPNKLVKALRASGVKVYRFSHHNTVGSIHANKRNAIVIDGVVAYLGNLDLHNNQLIGTSDMINSYIKLKGDVVQDIDLSAHKDVIFASGKYMPYEAPKRDIIGQSCNMQYVANEFSTDMELLIIKAICMAKKSIQLQLEQFIPTESIMSLLRFAINSNIDVKLMVPIKTNVRTKYYASRAYAKELALFGANVYLYDGFIAFNSIVIDGSIVLCGAYTLDREHLSTALQNILVIDNAEFAEQFNATFKEGINNSYRINNAKYMLTREKFFKNFV